jgi:hypothetical protein
VQVQAHDRAAELVKNLLPDQSRFGTHERLDLALEILRIQAEEYLTLVEDMKSQEAFMVVLEEFGRKAFENFTGIPLEAVVSARGHELQVIQQKVSDWVNEGYKRLIPAPLGTVEEPAPRRGYRAEVGPADRILETEQTFRRRAQRMDLLSSQARGRIEAQAQAEFQIEERKSEPRMLTPSGTKTEPKALRDYYFASFPEKVMVLDVCLAAKQHYREWVRWIGGQLKDGSKPDRAFRAVLNSKLRPEQYRTDSTRPKGWK